jgi:hypothetical protein
MVLYPAKIMGAHGKNKFYNTCFKYFRRINNAPKLVGSNEIENFDGLRAVFLNSENKPLFNCLRHELEDDSLLITDEQIGENFILAQSPEQREIMANSTHLAIDQNEKATPKGCCRTLSLEGKYRGIIFFTFFLFENLCFVLGTIILVFSRRGRGGLKNFKQKFFYFEELLTYLVVN